MNVLFVGTDSKRHAKEWPTGARSVETGVVDRFHVRRAHELLRHRGGGGFPERLGAWFKRQANHPRLSWGRSYPRVESQKFDLLELLEAREKVPALATPDQLAHQLRMDQRRFAHWLLRSSIHKIVFCDTVIDYEDRLLQAVADDLGIDTEMTRGQPV